MLSQLGYSITRKATGSRIPAKGAVNYMTSTTGGFHYELMIGANCKYSREDRALRIHRDASRSMFDLK